MNENADVIQKDADAPTPDVTRLLQVLEAQAAALNKSAGPNKGLRGASFRYGSLIAIVVFALGSVAIMEWMISQLPKPTPMPAPSFSLLHDGKPSSSPVPQQKKAQAN